jgi:hypothetical protein
MVRRPVSDGFAQLCQGTSIGLVSKRSSAAACTYGSGFLKKTYNKQEILPILPRGWT